MGEHINSWFVGWQRSAALTGAGKLNLARVIDVRMSYRSTLTISYRSRTRLHTHNCK